MLTKDLNKQTYRTTLGAENNLIVVGDEKTPNTFKPQFTAYAFKNTQTQQYENSLTIKPFGQLALDLADATPTLSSGKLEISKGKVGWYANPADGENFKFGVIWYEKPLSNKVSFQLEGYEEYNFLYQASLANENPDGSTWEQSNSGGIASRPADIVGSYAIYHKTKKNHEVGKINYKCGKVGHIKRPKFVDSDGKLTWGILTYENGVLTEECPQKFLDEATYPVKSNATWGSETQGASAQNKGGNEAGYFQIEGLAPAGTLTNLTVCLSSMGTADLQFGFYDFDDALEKPIIRYAYDSTKWKINSDTKNFYTNPVAWNYTLVEGTQYCCAIWSGDSSWNWFYDDVGTKKAWWQSNDAGGLDDPAGAIGGLDSANTCTPSAYATYTPSGGGAAAEPEQLIMIM